MPLDQITRKLIEKFSPMWTNKQVWEYEQVNENLRFDVAYANPRIHRRVVEVKTRISRFGHSRHYVVKTFDHLLDGNELWIAGIMAKENWIAKDTPYLMAVMADIMIEEEVCLNFRIANDCLVVVYR